MKRAESKSPADIVVRNTADAVLRDLMSALVRYVNSVSMGNADMAVSSGSGAFQEAGTRLRSLDAPQHLQADFSQYAGGWTFVGNGAPCADVPGVHQQNGPRDRRVEAARIHQQGARSAAPGVRQGLQLQR